MVQTQVSLSWDTYKSNICSGFSALQQNGEFVDMTLAADGHFVKVHQVMIALASPYLKDLMTSAPCQHPVIFLNNVSHRNMCLLLEYIYTGEVLVPAENLKSFAESAKSLHIRGLEYLSNNENMTFKSDSKNSTIDDGEPYNITGSKIIPVPTADSVEQVELPVAARKIYVKPELAHERSTKSSNISISKNDSPDYMDFMDDTGGQDSDNDYKEKYSQSHLNKETVKDKINSNLQFTVSIRGSLQIILNRYIYNLHSSKSRGGLRRWRCVDYRNNKCDALVITKGNVVQSRANLHNHPFHDKKILSKIENKSVFSALDEVQLYQEQQKAKEATEASDAERTYLTLDTF